MNIRKLSLSILVLTLVRGDRIDQNRSTENQPTSFTQEIANVNQSFGGFL